MEQIMDPIDIDRIADVPDTPDGLTRQRINGKSAIEAENHSLSPPLYSRKQNIFNGGSEDQQMIIDSRSGGPSMRPQKCTSNSNRSRCPVNSPVSYFLSTSSSIKANPFWKGVKEKNSSYPSHDSIHNHHQRSLRPSCIPKSSGHEDNFVDLSGTNTHGPVVGKSNLHSSFVGRTNFQSASHAGAEMNNVGGVGSNNDFQGGVGFVPFVGNNIQEKTSSGGFLCHDVVSSPRVNKQKRLVRNGCISPNNIAKARQLVGKDSTSCVGVGHDNNGTVAGAHENNGSLTFPHSNKSSKPSSARPLPFDIRELVADDNDSYARKGKGVMTHACSSKDDSRNNTLPRRSSMKLNEKAIGPSDFNSGTGKSFEEVGGWRSTRNRTSEMIVSSPDEEKGVIGESEPLRWSGQHYRNRLERSKKGVSLTIGANKGTDSITSGRSFLKPSKESISHHRTPPGGLNGSSSSASTLIKRQKQRSVSVSREGSTSISDDPEVVLLPASTFHNANNLEQVTEVAEISPQLRRNDDARARQVEADEALARELQEQLYNELPVLGAAEVEEHGALEIERQHDSIRRPSRARNHVFDASTTMLNLHRQSRSRSSLSGPRRASLARSASSGRFARLRSRFPGRARTLLNSGDTTSMFPEDMDVETRMHILGALEEFSDMGLITDINDIGLSGGIFQVPRDFNEDDYEMLLALDDNNDQHSGCSIRQINGLPESKVQTENFDETCAVCLETPTIGDSIRHLPCLHKFHKDCIDPWLRRKTSCPVCKSSVT